MTAGATLQAQEPSARYLAAEQPALVRQFELLATAPGGVARLRELILALAVRGKLVEQSVDDEPAAVLLQEIQLAKGGDVPRRRSRATDADDDIVAPFALPDSWEWVRLGEVTDISGGVTLGRKGTIEQPMTLPYLRVANVQRWNVLCDELKTITIGRAELARYQLRAGDLLITEGGDWDKVGRTAIWRDEIAVCLHQNHVFRARGLTPSWNPEWAQLYLNSPVARAYFASCSKQTTNLASINMTQLKACAFPLPPVAAQARIVARVGELMRLCDALEAKGRLEAEQHARLLGTLLGTLTDSSTPEELAANWQRVADHFDLLLDRPEAVDALEQTILQLAVRGLLVPQDPSDEPVFALMQRVRFAREATGSFGRSKRGDSSASQAMIDEPFALPAGWMWSTLPELCAITGGSTPSKAVADNWIGDIPWVSPKDMKVPVIEDAQDHVSSAALAGSLSLIPSGSLLMVVRGMILAHSFPVAVTHVPVTINQDMKALTPFEPKLLPFLLLLCEGMRTDVVALVDRSTHGTCKLESQKIFGLPIPLPPLAEQARILARVTELRRLCIELRQRLTASQTTQSHLADALVAEAA